MKINEIKKGDFVKAIFRKYGRHVVIGKVWEISSDETPLPGVWVSLRVVDGDKKDKIVIAMIENKINVMVPIKDVIETIIK